MKKPIAQNSVTGDELKSKVNSPLYQEGFDKAFAKKTVHYRGEANIVVGYETFVENVDHPLFDEGATLHTTRVLAYDKATGNFETKNTYYVKVA